MFSGQSTSLLLTLPKKQQIPNGHVSQIQSYTLSTATSTLNDHLRAAHDVKLFSNLKVFANL